MLVPVAGAGPVFALTMRSQGEFTCRGADPGEWMRSSSIRAPVRAISRPPDSHFYVVVSYDPGPQRIFPVMGVQGIRGVDGLLTLPVRDPVAGQGAAECVRGPGSVVQDH